MKNYDHIKLKVQLVQPAQAALWLESNTGNRKPRIHHVNSLAKEISEGRWQLNGSPIVISETGRLLDGQHRLLAICRANLPAPCVVIEGIADSSFTTIDCGTRRLLRDILFIEDEKYPVVLAGAIDWCICLSLGMVRGSLGKSYSERILFFNENAELRNSLAEVARRSASFRGMVISAPLLTALHYLFQQKDPTLAAAFLRAILDGAVEQPNFHDLREHLLRVRLATAKPPAWDMAARVIKSWNATRAGERVKLIRWAPQQELFPTIN